MKASSKAMNGDDARVAENREPNPGDKASLLAAGPHRLNRLRPKADNPFIIVTPPYTRISAGITVLHLLCHYLNEAGENAFILHYPIENDPRGLLPSYAKLQVTGEFPGGMNAPLITQDVIEYYARLKLTPIVIYPEVFDNVFNAPFFARYILNYPGLLAPRYKQDAAVTFAYSRILADNVGAEEVLYMCTADLDYWNQSGASDKRDGTCYYAGKGQAFLGRTPVRVPPGSIQILQSQDMPRDKVRELFWRSSAFYCYEDTALATEAALCGCPVVFVPNQDFSGVPLASTELGWAGSCITGDPAEFRRAQETVDTCGENVRETFAVARGQIIRLAKKLKDAVQAQPYRGTITLPLQPRLVLFDQAVETRTLGFRKGEAMPPLKADAAPHRTSAMTAPNLPVGRRTIQALEAEINDLRASTSWRITAPLRSLMTFLRKR